jgi:hypothetical protein
VASFAGFSVGQPPIQFRLLVFTSGTGGGDHDQNHTEHHEEKVQAGADCYDFFTVLLKKIADEHHESHNTRRSDFSKQAKQCG